MKRTSIEARRPVFSTLFKLCFSCAFGAVLFTLVLVLPVARIDPRFTPASFAGGLVGVLTVWPLAVAIWFSVGGWLLLWLLGLKWRFRFTFVCEDADESPSSLEKTPGQTPEPAPSFSVRKYMKKSLILVLATALITAVTCYLITKPQMSPQVARLVIDSPDREFVAVVVTDDWEHHGLRTVVQSVHLVRRSEADGPSEIKAGTELAFRGQTLAAIHSCENSQIDVRWTGARSVLIRYSQTKPDWISFVEVVDGVTVSVEDTTKEPNQPPEPAALVVTPRAFARVAQRTAVAHLYQNVGRSCMADKMSSGRDLE